MGKELGKEFWPKSAKWRILNSQGPQVETEAIADAWADRKVLKKGVKSPDSTSRNSSGRGFPAGPVAALAEKLHLGNTVLSRKLGIPQRTLTRRLSQSSTLTPAESDRMVRIARVYANAVEMIGDREKAIEWLNTPNRALGGERPLDEVGYGHRSTDGAGRPRPHRLWRVQLMRFWRICRQQFAAEAYRQSFPSLKLADVYQVIGYYLKHGSELAQYLEHHAREEKELLETHRDEWSPRGLCERLLARERVMWLADENFDNAIIRGLLRQTPTLDIIRAQDVPEISGQDDRCNPQKPRL